MLKWIIILFIGAVAYMIATGNMGGSKKATQNYVNKTRGIN